MTKHDIRTILSSIPGINHRLECASMETGYGLIICHVWIKIMSIENHQSCSCSTSQHFPFVMNGNMTQEILRMSKVTSSNSLTRHTDQEFNFPIEISYSLPYCYSQMRAVWSPHNRNNVKLHRDSRSCCLGWRIQVIREVWLSSCCFLWGKSSWEI